VGDGTPWLYDAFPAAKLVLFEPQSVFDGPIEEICRRHNAVRHRVALSDHAGAAMLSVPTAVPTGASLMPRVASSGNGSKLPDVEEIEVTLARLDDLNSYEAPYLLKIDAEGAERTILEGAPRTLEGVELLIVEAGILPRHEGGASFAELVMSLDERGFRVLDIPSMSQSATGGILVYLDVAFVRKDDERWLRR
jgi:FkbM family methyltransferase